MTKSKGNALVVPQRRTELALPDALVSSARWFASKSRSERTMHEYHRCWRHFLDWCDTHSRASLPASMETVAAFIVWLAEGRGGTTKPLAISSIDQMLSALKFAHEFDGHAFNSKSPALREVWRGIRREIAKTRTVRRVSPLLAGDLKDILDRLQPERRPREGRDRALLALGWAGALRRSELVGLDWQTLGTHKDARRTGTITIEDKGITITLMTSKASQEKAETVAIPRVDAPLICTVIAEWIDAGAIQPGMPLFPPMDGQPKRKSTSVGRLTTQSVANIIKRHIHLLAEARGKGRKKMTREQIAALKAQFSGHSMRAGYVTSAAEHLPTHRIQQQTRHKSADMVNTYIREADKFGKSGLRGVGF